MNYKILIEKLKFSENDLDKQISSLNGYIRLLVKKRGFYLKVTAGEKTYPQLKAFYEAVNQLLPQYNNRQLEQGKKDFFEDEFKFILKYVGGWYKEIENKKGEIIPIEKSFKGICKEDMMKVLNNIQRWAINSGFSLSIDKELMDLIK